MPGFQGLMKSVPVSLLKIALFKTRPKGPCCPPPSCDGTEAAFVFNKVCTEFIVL